MIEQEKALEAGTTRAGDDDTAGVSSNSILPQSGSECKTPFEQFLDWESTTRGQETVSLKLRYVDMTGDLIAGLLLSELVYWYLPGRDGRSKLRVKHDGHYWIAKQREDWWDEIRISPKQFDRACAILEEKGLVVKAYHRFNGLRTIHLRLDPICFMELWRGMTQTETPVLTKGQDRNSPKVKTGIPQREIPLTSATSSTTPSTTTETPPPPGMAEDSGNGGGGVAQALEELLELGVEEPVAEGLAQECPGVHVTGWCAYALTSPGIRDPPAYVVSKLKAGESPPRQRVKARKHIDLTCRKCGRLVDADQLCPDCGYCLFDGPCCCTCDESQAGD